MPTLDCPLCLIDCAGVVRLSGETEIPRADSAVWPTLSVDLFAHLDFNRLFIDPLTYSAPSRS